jgi:hypothetical protein
MIITREVVIRINEYNFSYYDNLGYEPILGEFIVIPIELLSNGSQIKIDCQCDGCGIIKTVIYKNYIKYGNEWGFYYCRKCSEYKRKRSLLSSYGVEYPIQKKEILSKILETKKINKIIEKYNRG